MSDDLDPRLLAKWAAGGLTSDERRTVEQWVAADPTRAAELQQARELWRRSGDVARDEAAAPDFDEAAMWTKILGAIRSQEEGLAPPPADRPTRPFALEFPARRRPVGRWVAAAALVLAVGGGVGVWNHRERRQIAEAARPMRVYETARGERADFRLRDGTRVMLNVASRMRVPADFGERSREVYLEGGAYFDVVHDSTRPFGVHAGDIVARDLGTEFTVGAYPEQAHARVVVREGLVALHAAAAPDSAAGVMLRPGQGGRLDGRGQPNVERADTNAEFAWTGGTLVFDDTPLGEALPQLGRWFDLEFRLADSSLSRIRLAATLTNQPTDDALRFLAVTLGLRADRRGGVVILHPASPQRTP